MKKYFLCLLFSTCLLSGCSQKITPELSLTKAEALAGGWKTSISLMKRGIFDSSRSVEYVVAYQYGNVNDDSQINNLYYQILIIKYNFDTQEREAVSQPYTENWLIVWPIRLIDINWNWVNQIYFKLSIWYQTFIQKIIKIKDNKLIDILKANSHFCNMSSTTVDPELIPCSFWHWNNYYIVDDWTDDSDTNMSCAYHNIWKYTLDTEKIEFEPAIKLKSTTRYVFEDPSWEQVSGKECIAFSLDEVAQDLWFGPQDISYDYTQK